MAVWLVRAGSHGEYEQKFVSDKRIYLTWDAFNLDLSTLTDRQPVIDFLASKETSAKVGRLRNHASQIWPFAHEMQVGDMIVLPSKLQQSIYVGEITGNYAYSDDQPSPFLHWRDVKWVSEPIPRSHFSQDLLYSFGAFMTICRIQRNNAEARLLAMKATGWKPESVQNITAPAPPSRNDEEQIETDIEALALDQISKYIVAKFKGHDLTRLVDGILKAQGYTTYRSPEGPDGGIDILAGTGPLGFGNPRLCVQVKSQDSPVERRVINELSGAMKSVGATEGLFVAWGGYKSSVLRITGQEFFNIRLWDQKDLLNALFATFNSLDDELKAELPFKRIWTLAGSDADGSE